MSAPPKVHSSVRILEPPLGLLTMPTVQLKLLWEMPVWQGLLAVLVVVVVVGVLKLLVLLIVMVLIMRVLVVVLWLPRLRCVPRLRLWVRWLRQRMWWWLVLPR